MAFDKLTEDLDIIQSLPRIPGTELPDYTDVQKKFDEGPNKIKTFLNELIDALGDSDASDNIGFDSFDGVTGDTVQDALEALQQNILDIQAGVVTDGSISTSKLANLAVTTAKLAELAVTEGKIASGAVTEAKIGAGAVTTAKIADSAVTAAKLAATCVTVAKLSTDVLAYFRKASDTIAMTDVTGNLASNRVSTADGNLGALVLSNGVHFFSTLAAYQASEYYNTNALCFVKA